MPFIAVCEDDPTVDTAALRRREKDAHFAYIEEILDQLLEDDPYYRAGIYGRVRLAPFVPAAGQWIGGTIW